MCGCSCNSTTDATATTTSTASAGAAAFTVPDMTCGHCEKAVRGAFDKAMPGTQVEIDLAAKRVVVHGDAATAQGVLSEAGYTPEPA
ncbi:heavy-metal-associated domain-containing protein [Roseivivax sp. CAU 1761]